MRQLIIVLPFMLACAADNTGEPLLAGFTPLAPPDNGMQVILPIVHGLQPGTDTEMCTWSDKVMTSDLDVKSVTAFQSQTGHHVIIYTTHVKQPPGTTRPCTEDDMSTFRFAVASGGEGTGVKNTAPGDLVYRLDTGAQLVFNHHYINATDHAMDAQSGMNIEYATANPKNIPSGSMAIVDTSLNLPPGTSSVDINCTVQKDVKVWWAIPHMHTYGTHILYELDRSGVIEPLFDIAWDPAFMFNPPAIKKDPTAPLMLAPGDKFHIKCDYNNTTSSALTFGLEMCVGYSSTVDDNGVGNVVCDRGSWGTF